MGGHENVAEKLLMRGADMSNTDEKGQTLLHLAVRSRSPQRVTLLLNRGAAISVQDHEGRTPLHPAAERGSQKMMKLLIGQGAEASLHLPARLGYRKATKLLVDGGALVSAVDGNGCTARDLGRRDGHGVS